MTQMGADVSSSSAEDASALRANLTPGPFPEAKGSFGRGIVLL
jgi:hypothetical protein